MTTIRVPLDDLPKVFRQYHDQQTFAVARALTLTANDIRKDLKGGDLRKHLTLRNRYTENSIRVERATKQTLRAEVGSIAWYMERQVIGGTSRPRIGVKFNGKKYLLTPTAHMKTKSGRLKKQPADKKTFVIASKSGKVMLVRRRYKRKRLPLVVLAYLDEQHVYDKKLPWDRMTSQNIEKIFGRNFKRSMIRAIRTAR